MSAALVRENPQPSVVLSATDNVYVTVQTDQRNLEAALLSACRRSDVAQIGALLPNRASMNSRDGKGRTPLMLVCRSKSACNSTTVMAVEALIRGGADVNAEDSFGCAALTYAVTADNSLFKVSVMDALVEAGADVNHTGPDGYSPFAQVTADLLRLAHVGSSLRFKEHFEPIEHLRALFALLVVHGARVDWRDRDGKTLLMKACEKSQNDVALDLIQAGANVSLVANDGQTAISICIKIKNNELVEYFKLSNPGLVMEAWTGIPQNPR